MKTTRLNKYELVGEMTRGCRGRLVDIGSRDRILREYLKNPNLDYVAADVTGDFDLSWDLERPIPAADGSVDYVVALDVLEHIEHIHQALRELIRITGKSLYITLPNMECLTMRWNFFRTGQVSGKYSLLPEHQGDRHRWLTTYDASTRLVQSASLEKGCGFRKIDIRFGYTRLHQVATRLPLPARLTTYTLFYEITKPAA